MNTTFSGKRLHFFYRATAGENNKGRPPGYSKKQCLLSFLRAYRNVADHATLTFLNDGPMTEDRARLQHQAGTVITLPALGNSGSHRAALTRALWLPDDALVYFAEDDYLYTEHAFVDMLAAFDALPKADYLTLYDHPDRYRRSDDADGGRCRLSVAGGHHWRNVESTCMTFGARVAVLRRDAWIQRAATALRTPKDRFLWRLTQGQKWYVLKFPKRVLLGAVPAAATHMEANTLAPVIDWAAVGREADAYELRLMPRLWS